MIRIRSQLAVVAIICAGSAGGCATAQTAAERVAVAAVDFVTPTGGSIGSGIIWQDPLGVVHRSEEHTSELQSRLHLVCRLLLEKKKKKKKKNNKEQIKKKDT